MRLGRPLKPIGLTADERSALEGWARRRTTAQALALRARIILHAAEGESNTAIARGERVTKATVGKWRGRFLRKRLEGLLDEPRPGAPRKITDTAVEGIITKTLETTPRDATHWSTRSMSRAGGLSQSAISRIWRVGLEILVRRQSEAGRDPGSGRPNAHGSDGQGPSCVPRRRSVACGRPTMRENVPRYSKPGTR